MKNLDNSTKRIAHRLHFLYEDSVAKQSLSDILNLLKKYSHLTRQKSSQIWSEKDVVLITYADQVRHSSNSPLHTLNRFLIENNLKSLINTIHLLPFYPSSGDDGFSVIDYAEVDPEIGTWNDVGKICKNFNLMFDLVLNHISQRSDWFNNFCQGVPQYHDYFIKVDPGMDISSVVRPRSLPLFHEFETLAGPQNIWTTFSRDQVDLNYKNPHVLYSMLEILLQYVECGARIIRLDAVAFLWKSSGTSCIHLEQTHEIIKLIRDVLTIVAPHVIILTETNVPHKENISYFGKGDEAHMVYQFSLPPLLADALLQEDVGSLKQWLFSVGPAPPGTTYLNFTASHDGIGVRPLEGLVSRSRIESLALATKLTGGKIGTRTTLNGEEIPYELNVTYRDLLGIDQALTANRFIISQALMLSLAGIPAIYFHSLVGSGNDILGMNESGIARRINRQRYEWDELSKILMDKNGLQYEIFNRYCSLITIRVKEKAFHPDGKQTILNINNKTVLGFTRMNPTETESIVVLYNFSSKDQTFLFKNNSKHLGIDLITNEQVNLSSQVSLAPLMFRWIKFNNPVF